MASLNSLDTLFKYRHFAREIIILCVRWYVNYKLSYQDLVEMMAERGVRFAYQLYGAGFNVSSQCSRSAGCALLAPWVSPGGSTRPTFALEGR